MTTAPALIVVGVDGTPESDAALAFAIDEATRSGDSLEVVTVWDTDTTLTTLDLIYGVVTCEAEQEAERQQRESLERALPDQTQTITIASRVERGQPGPVLVQAARKARLLVLGTRALGPVRAAILGSVSRYCARHVEGALVVVPALSQSDRTHGNDTDQIVPAF